MFDAVLAFNLVEHLGGATVEGGSPGYGRLLTPHRGPHRTADGHIAMIPYTDRQWMAVFDVVGKTDLLRDRASSDRRSLADDADAMYSLLASVIAERTTEEWLVLCQALGVPAAPVPTLDEIVEHPEHHRGVLRAVEHPVVGPYRHIEPPIRFSDGGRESHLPSPLRAQDTDEILGEVGYTPAEIDDLVERGIVSRREEPAG